MSVRELIRPATDESYASINVNALDIKRVKKYKQRILGLGRRRRQINVRVTSEENVTPEARKKVKGDILVTTV